MNTIFEDFVMLGAVSSFVALFVVIGLSITNHIHTRRIERIFTQIYKESEMRIGNANLMVTQCTESLKVQSLTADHITDMYKAETTNHLAQLDYQKRIIYDLTEQNKELSHSVNELSSILSHKKDQTINFHQ